MTYFANPRLLANRLLWWWLPLLGSLTGCSPDFYQASFDAALDQFAGPSYSGYSTGDLYAGNIGASWVSTIGAPPLRVFRAAAASSLLASNTDRPGLTTPPDKGAFLSHISFLYGPQLIGKGGKASDGYGTTTSRRTYLEGIGYALYNYDLPNNKGRVFGGLGPYLGFGLWGKTKYEQATYGTQSYGAFDKLNGYKRFDAGLAFTVGYQLPQGLRLSIAHELGLVNIDPFGNGDDKTKSRSWSLNVSYPAKKLVTLVKKK